MNTKWVDPFELTLIKVIEQIESSPIGRAKKVPSAVLFPSAGRGQQSGPFFFRSIKWSAPSSNPTKIHDASADYYFIFFFFGFHKIERRRRQGRTNCGPRQLLPVVNCCSDRTQVKQHTDRWHGSAVYTTAPSAASQQKQTTTDNTRIYRL